jgi:hypothetical protein
MARRTERDHVVVVVRPAVRKAARVVRLEITAGPTVAGRTVRVAALTP